MFIGLMEIYLRIRMSTRRFGTPATAEPPSPRNLTSPCTSPVSTGRFGTPATAEPPSPSSQPSGGTRLTSTGGRWWSSPRWRSAAIRRNSIKLLYMHFDVLKTFSLHEVNLAQYDLVLLFLVKFLSLDILLRLESEGKVLSIGS